MPFEPANAAPVRQELVERTATALSDPEQRLSVQVATEFRRFPWDISDSAHTLFGLYLYSIALTQASTPSERAVVVYQSASLMQTTSMLFPDFSRGVNELYSDAELGPLTTIIFGEDSTLKPANFSRANWEEANRQFVRREYDAFVKGLAATPSVEELEGFALLSIALARTLPPESREDHIVTAIKLAANNPFSSKIFIEVMTGCSGNIGGDRSDLRNLWARSVNTSYKDVISRMSPLSDAHTQQQFGFTLLHAAGALFEDKECSNAEIGALIDAARVFFVVSAPVQDPGYTSQMPGMDPCSQLEAKLRERTFN